MNQQSIQRGFEESPGKCAQDSNEALQSAMNVSFRLVLWPCLCVLVFLAKSHVHFPLRDGYQAMMILLIVAISATSFMIGDCIGYLAHYLFWRRIKIPVSYVASVMTLVFDFVIIGWTVVIFRAV
ncbi:MAG: hypothetical protein JWP89_5109 [Schlesneria sp.]|jgi:hypothetical protein|nr:hypothetical protein [Schlesneria sp.]